jgi:polygalacturonase
MINPPSWTLVTYYAGDVNIDGIKQITAGNGRDGIDVVMSRDVTIKNCILSCGDDCIVIKAFNSERYPEVKNNNWMGCKNVLVEDCILHGFGAQALEIGHELRQNPVDNIVHRNIDVLASHGQGGVFGIRNCESATVTNVLYENIRVDHYFNKLVDIRVIKSRYSKQEERGHIDGVKFKDIYVKTSKYNAGYSISLIGGYDEDHKVKNVTFENFQLDGEKVTNGDELDLFVKQAEGIVFK